MVAYSPTKQTIQLALVSPKPAVHPKLQIYTYAIIPICEADSLGHLNRDAVASSPWVQLGRQSKMRQLQQPHRS